jgi:predicted Rossmann-fold nucleotide-binding protein
MKKLIKHRFRIAFFGDATAKKRNPQFLDAYDTAQLMAKNKYTTINGGGPGIMLASTLGAKSIKGRVENVVVDSKNEPSRHYEGQSLENVSQANHIYSLKSYEGRLNKIIKLANAYVIFYGGTGTLAEMAYVWSEAKFDYPHQKPLIFFGKKWRKVIRILSQELNLEKIEQRVCYFVDKPEQVLDIIKTYSKINSQK